MRSRALLPLPSLSAALLLVPLATLCVSCDDGDHELEDDIEDLLDDAEPRLSGGLYFHDAPGCTLPQSVKDGVQAGWDELYGTGGRASSDAFKHALARQLFDADLQGGSASCKAADPLDTTALPSSWSYAVNGFKGLGYWNELLDGDGQGDGTFPPVGGGATRFDGQSYPDATTADLMYSLSNTTYDVHFNCVNSTTMSAGPVSAGHTESYNLGKNISADTEWYSLTLIHEAMHNRHFDHSCGRPQISARTATNHIDTSAANGGWSAQPYASTTPSKAVELNTLGWVFPATLMGRWNSDINGNSYTQHEDETGPYPNSWLNHHLLSFKGHDEVRLYFGRISTEAGYDYVRVYDDDDQLVVSYSGEREDVWTPWIKGPNIRVEFESDGSIPKACGDSYDCMGTAGGYTTCDQSSHMCVKPSDPDKSFMGYELVTFEGRGVNNERLIDLYRDTVSEYENDQWDRFDTYLVDLAAVPGRLVADRTIESPNYLEPVPGSTDAVGDSSHGFARATLNDSSDRDVFRLWARNDGDEGWTPNDRGYRVVFETEGSTDVMCTLYGPDGSGGFTELAFHDDIDGSNNRNCRIEMPIGRIDSASAPYYYVEVEGYAGVTGDYTANFTTEVVCDIEDDGRSNDTIDRAETIQMLLDPSNGGWSGGVSNRTACVSSDRVFEFFYDGGTTTTLRALFSDVDGDLDLEVLDAAGNVLISRDSSTDDEEILPNEWPATMSAGTYWVRVFAYGNYAHNINDFDLQVSY